MNLIEKSILNSLDRFKKLRIGQISSDIDENGEISVRWLDGEPGGQSNIILSYPGFNNTGIQPHGIEVGYGIGTVGIFGFTQDNHAILLTTIISKIKGKKVGYDKTEKIKSGEFRVSSKLGSKLFLDSEGNIQIICKNNLSIQTENASIIINKNGKIDLNTTEEITINCKKMTINSNTNTTVF